MSRPRQVTRPRPCLHYSFSFPPCPRAFLLKETLMVDAIRYIKYHSCLELIQISGLFAFNLSTMVSCVSQSNGHPSQLTISAPCYFLLLLKTSSSKSLLERNVTAVADPNTDRIKRLYARPLRVRVRSSRFAPLAWGYLGRRPRGRHGHPNPTDY